MRGNLGDKVRLLHLYDAILEIESYLKNVQFPDFLENSMMRFACIKQMEIIGEAGNHISDNTKSRFSTIETIILTFLSNAKNGMTGMAKNNGTDTRIRMMPTLNLIDFFIN